MKRLFPFFAALSLAAAACAPDKVIKLVPPENFESTLDGKPTAIYTIMGGNLTAQITNYGARVVSLWVPDRDGIHRDVVIGYGNIDAYVNNPGERFLGSSPGPVANRIGGASFELDGIEYQLEKNDGENTLHGGFVGIDRLVWDVVDLQKNSITLSVLHPDGFGGFPGNKTITAKYTLTADHALKVEFSAVTDAPTPMNIAHHPFFNLKGTGNGNILEHVLMINASGITPVDSTLIPTGRVLNLDGSPLDFRKPCPIGLRIDADDPQLRYGLGYDHNWVLDGGDGGSMALDASVFEPESGTFLEVLSDQPGLQFYSGNFFGDGKTVDKFGNPIAFRGAFALETQKFPDAVHHPNFPDTILRPGDTYKHTCLYRFSVR